MSVTRTPDDDASARLGEGSGSQLFDNDRIEKLYNHLRDIVKEYCAAAEPPDYPTATNEIKQILNEHLSIIRAADDKCTAALNAKTLENNALRDTIRALKAKQNDYDQSQVLQQGIDAYIQQRTKDLEESLRVALKEKDDIYTQFEEEKRAHKAEHALVRQYQSQNGTLTTLINQMHSCDQYNAATINAEIAAERGKLQPLYDELKVKCERYTFERDQHFNDKLDAICQAISKPEDVTTKIQSLWKQDLEELNEIYEERLNEKEVEWQRKIKILQKENKAQSKQIRLSKQRTIETIQEYQRLDEENNELQQEVNDLTESTESLSEQVQSMTIQIKTQRDNDIEQKERLSALEQDNEKLNNELELKKNEMNALQTRYDELNERLSKELESKNNEINALQIQCNELNEKLNNELELKSNELNALQTQCNALNEKLQCMNHMKPSQVEMEAEDTKFQHYDTLLDKIENCVVNNQMVSTDDMIHLKAEKQLNALNKAAQDMGFYQKGSTTNTAPDTEDDRERDLLSQLLNLESTNSKLMGELETKTTENRELEEKWNETFRKQKEISAEKMKKLEEMNALLAKYKALLLVLCSIIVYYFVLKYVMRSSKYQHWWKLILRKMNKNAIRNT